MYFVYVLVSQSKGLRFYVGLTTDLEKRLKQHNAGETFSTKPYCPWELFFFEKHPTSSLARDREKHLKGGSGKEKIKRDWAQFLAKKEINK